MRCDGHSRQFPVLFPRPSSLSGKNAKCRRRFRADLARQRLIVAPPVHEGHFQSARKLLVQYGVVEGLPTLDALQLAIALDLHRLEHIAVLVAADQRLCRVSSLAGCTAINPEQPSPISISNLDLSTVWLLKPVLRGSRRGETRLPVQCRPEGLR